MNLCNKNNTICEYNEFMSLIEPLLDLDNFNE